MEQALNIDSMPNLSFISSLRAKYSNSPINNRVKSRELKLLTENFNRSIIDIKASFNIQGVDDHIIQYFEQQKSANVTLLFIDISNFSKKCEELSNEELSKYLDRYYDIVIPIIYRHGGEIEKIIGDGIICLFGEPFLSDSKDSLFEKTDKCAKDIVIELKNSIFEVKIALHDGTIMYYKNKTLNYPEYTTIGKPLTELFRLESVSENNSINFYHVSKYDKKDYSSTGVYCMSFRTTCSHWTKSNLIKVDLKGVNWSYIKRLECTYRT